MNANATGSPRRERYLTVPSAFEQLTGQRPSAATVCRWALRGVKGVKLETWMIGGRRMTTMNAVQTFIADRTAATEAPPPPAINAVRPASTKMTKRKLQTIAKLNRKLGVA